MTADMNHEPDGHPDTSGGMYIPNLRDSPRSHRECIDVVVPYRNQSAGALRHCQHLKVQVLVDQGDGVRYWRTLHPVFDFRSYYRASRLLNSAPNSPKEGWR